MRTIIAAIDFTPLTEQVLKRASDLAKSFDARLWLVHIAEPDPEFVGYEVGPQHVRDNRAETLRAEHRQLQTSARGLQDHGIWADALLVQGPLVRSLLEKASDLQAELIVIGAHSHSRLFDRVVGSTWQDLIRQSTIPLLVVPELTE